VARVIIGPHVASFLADNPELAVDLVVRDQLGDMIADGFDAAVRFGEPEPSTLITRKLLETRVLTCASAAYLEGRSRPSHPRELTKHECILFRNPRTGRPYEWVFKRGSKTLSVHVTGRLILKDSATQIAACMAGHGVAQPLESN
jgi:DNA-binding transcriptional LysR family regulator